MSVISNGIHYRQFQL